MVWFLVMHVFSTLLDCLWLGRHSDQEKELQILLLRRQLAIAERKLKQPLHISHMEKLTLAVLAARLRAVTGCSIQQLDNIIRLFQPETVFKWHRELVRRKWSYRRTARGGRPRTQPEIERLIVRLARENSDWGYSKIEGELLKLGYTLDEETVANIWKRYGIPPAPLRRRSSSWRQLMTHYQEQILACDFFTVETFFLKTLYVLVFIELGSRRVHFAGCTVHPNEHWVTQQARQLVWKLESQEPTIRFLIHDNDTKFRSSPLTRFFNLGTSKSSTPRTLQKTNSCRRWS
jgi:putative transposase